MEAVTLTRQEGWEARLVDVIEAARHVPYRLGAHDCLRLSCACIEMTTGVDFWPRFAGYSTRREAARTMARIAPTVSEAVSITLGQRPVPPFSARRGDLVRYRDVEDHLGICVGSTVAVMAPDGLVFVALDHPGLVESWRIG